MKDFHNQYKPQNLAGAQLIVRAANNEALPDNPVKLPGPIQRRLQLPCLSK